MRLYACASHGHDERYFPLALSVTGQPVARAHAVGALSPARSRDQTRRTRFSPFLRIAESARNVGEINIRSIVVNNISGSLSWRRYLSPVECNNHRHRARTRHQVFSRECDVLALPFLFFFDNLREYRSRNQENWKIWALHERRTDISLKSGNAAVFGL